MRNALSTPAPQTSAAPIDAAGFVSLMQPFGPLPTRLAIAVSGGPDSMALAWCTKSWLNSDVIAFIVDHDLREESAREAETVQKTLADFGMCSEILRWDHAPVVTKLHMTARKARYKLLIEACRHHGITRLLLAHQREDQAETILMRLAKGSGIDGLAGIAAQTQIDGIQLLRPFLPVAKERLIATCTAAKIPFVTDPSNLSAKFARGRLRRVMPLLADEGLTVDRLIDLGSRAADAKDALDHYTRELLQTASARDEAGVIRVELTPLRTAPRAIALRALGLALQNVNSQDYAPEHAALARLADHLRGAAEMNAVTLHGCLVSKTATQAIILREFAGIIDAPTIRAGETILWDGRWSVTNTSEETLAVRPLGNPPHEVIDRLAPGLRKRAPQGRARAALPALWRDETLVAFAEAKLISDWPAR